MAVQYAKLSIKDIKTLEVDDKWLTTLATDVQTEYRQDGTQPRANMNNYDLLLKSMSALAE